MNWKKECFKNFRLYAVTDLRDEDSRVLDQIARALKGGVDVIQLRSKTLSDGSLVRLSQKIRVLTSRLHRLFLVNDRVDVMMAVNADGVHLGQEDLPIPLARRIAGKDKIIGRSTHSLKQAVEAEREGADYIGFGPLFRTPTKPDYPPVGLGLISNVMKQVRVPVVVIGGVDRSNIDQVVSAGAKRVAVVRAVFGALDPFLAAQELKKRIPG